MHGSETNHADGPFELNADAQRTKTFYNTRVAWISRSSDVSHQNLLSRQPDNQGIFKTPQHELYDWRNERLSNWGKESQMKLTDEQLDKLLEVIEWWVSRKPFSEETSKVRFDREDPKVASVRMGHKMYKDAVALAEADPNIGNFSRLVEIAVWKLLGSSDEYLK
jgi:hypothetical protein